MLDVLAHGTACFGRIARGESLEDGKMHLGELVPVDACGEDREGDVQFQGTETTGTETTGTTGTETTGTTATTGTETTGTETSP